jgi:hypothetical protein
VAIDQRREPFGFDDQVLAHTPIIALTINRAHTKAGIAPPHPLAGQLRRR